MTLHRAGRLHHLKVGAVHAQTRILAIVDGQEVTVLALATGGDPVGPRHRARQGLLAAYATRPRPMAEVSEDGLITCVAYVATQDRPSRVRARTF
jgi:hypothetical protein